MNRTTALQKMMKWDKQGRYVFTLADLTKIFAEDSPKALQEVGSDNVHVWRIV